MVQIPQFRPCFASKIDLTGPKNEQKWRLCLPFDYRIDDLKLFILIYLLRIPVPERLLVKRGGVGVPKTGRIFGQADGAQTERMGLDIRRFSNFQCARPRVNCTQWRVTPSPWGSKSGISSPGGISSYS
jgi:hypothetical protein